jgi:cell division protein FtsL
MRIYTLLGWLSLIVVASYAMFHISYEVEQVEGELRALNRQTLTEQEAIHVLKAEWSHLNRPEYLRELSGDLLPNMQDPTVAQIGTLDQIPERSADTTAQVSLDVVRPQ